MGKVDCGTASLKASVSEEPCLLTPPFANLLDQPSFSGHSFFVGRRCVVVALSLWLVHMYACMYVFPPRTNNAAKGDIVDIDIRRKILWV